MTTLRVVKGVPDDDELAAVVVAVSLALARRDSDRVPAPPSRWRRPLPSGPLPRGAGAWRSAARPT